MVPLMILSLNDNMIDQFTAIIDISVTVFLFIYLVCVLSYFKLMVFNKDRFKLSRLILSVLAFVFCIWALLASDFSMVALSSIIVLVGVPVYLVKRKTW
jgi:APA family basic amino acid/polyamine antiporter